MSPAGDRVRQARQQGFTLLELLVVLVIASLIVVAVPQIFQRFAGAATLRHAAEQLTNDLRNAHLEALETHRMTAIEFDLPRKTYRFEDGASTKQLPDDVSLTLTSTEIGRVSETKAHIRFFPDGSSTGGRIELHAKNRQYVVLINWVTGRVQLNG